MRSTVSSRADGRMKMNWYSDKERFDEYDDPYCIWKSKLLGGKCGNSKAECDRCMKNHIKEMEGEYDVD